MMISYIQRQKIMKQVAVSDFYKQRLLDLEAIKRKCDELARGCRQILEEGGEAVP